MNLLWIVLLSATLGFSKENPKESLIDNIITKMDLNIEGDVAGFDGKKLSEQVKKDLKNKMLSNYKVEELKEIQTTLNDTNFSKVNKEVTETPVKVEDLLLKTPDAEFAKLNSEKKSLATGLEKKLDFKKYSKVIVSLMGDKLVESYAENLPSSIVKTMRSELSSKAEGGMLANLYEKVGLLDVKNVKQYSTLIEKKSFQKYYHDLMDISIKNINKSK